jgi:hypothetical protein
VVDWVADAADFANGCCCCGRGEGEGERKVREEDEERREMGEEQHFLCVDKWRYGKDEIWRRAWLYRRLIFTW